MDSPAKTRTAIEVPTHKEPVESFRRQSAGSQAHPVVRGRVRRARGAGVCRNRRAGAGAGECIPSRGPQRASCRPAGELRGPHGGPASRRSRLHPSHLRRPGGGSLGASLPCGAGHAGRSAALAGRRHRPRTEAQPAGAAGHSERAVRSRPGPRRLLCAASQHEGDRLHQRARTQPGRHGIQALVAGGLRLPARNRQGDREGGHHQRAVQRRPGPSST